jgi:putative SOS response-associated peptidase YedK
MCGRFILLTDLSVIVDSFRVGEVATDYKTGNNISPGQQISAIIRDQDINKLVSFRWGLIPAWAKDPAIGNKMFNARAESVAEKPSYRDAFKKRRCLIVADGFYEWEKINRIKKPLLFSLKSGEPFALAGLYESWTSPEKKVIRTCTIITTEPNDLLCPIHDRMPVIVPADRQDFWIDAHTQNQKALLSILAPYPSDGMKMSEGFMPIP